jgi:hypothetical protein
MRRSHPPAPVWFSKLLRFLVRAALPAALLFGPSLPWSTAGLPLEITGEVTAAYGGGCVQGARVSVAGDPVRYQAFTNANGLFRLHLPPLGSGDEPDEAWDSGYVLAVEKEGMVPEPEAFRVHIPVPDPLPRHIGSTLLHPVAAKVGGTVLGADGQPVPGAKVLLFEKALRTDEQGKFGPVAVPAGRLRIEAGVPGAAGYATIFVPHGVDRAVTVEIPLIAGLRLSDGDPEGPHHTRGRLCHSDGAPAVGYTIFTGPGQAVTGPDGGFELEVPHEHFCFLICLRGRTLRAIFIADPGEQDPVYHLPPMKQVSGRVRSALTGEPLPDVAVQPLNVLTDGWGRFEAEIPDQDDGSLRVHLSKAGYGRLSAEKLDPEGFTEFFLDPLAEVRLRVLRADGSASAGIRIDFLDGPRCYTDPQGRAGLWVQPGQSLAGFAAYENDVVHILPRNTGVLGWIWRRLASLGIFTPAKVDVFVLEPGERRNLGTFRLEPGTLGPMVFGGSTILIVTPDGRAIPHPFSVDGPAQDVFLVGDEKGRIRPGGRLLTADGFESVELGSPSGLPPQIVLRPAAPITGRVVREDGSPEGDLELITESASHAGKTHPISTLMAVTDTLGRFTIHGVPRGEKVKILASRRRGRLILGEAAGGDRELVLTISR